MSNKCCATAWSGFHSYPCSAPGKFDRDGKWYCGIHDPVKVAERKAKQEAKYAAKQAESDRKWEAIAERERRADLFPEMLEALKAAHKLLNAIYNNELWAGKDEYVKPLKAVIAKAEGR